MTLRSPTSCPLPAAAHPPPDRASVEPGQDDTPDKAKAQEADSGAQVRQVAAAAASARRLACCKSSQLEPLRDGRQL